MDHVASGWNGWKSINIFVPGEETYGVPVVSGDLDFFRPILSRVVSGGTYLHKVWKDFGGWEGGDGRGEESEVLRDKNIQVIFVLGFVLSFYTSFCIVFLGWEGVFLALSQITPMSKIIFKVYIVYVFKAQIQKYRFTKQHIWGSVSRISKMIFPCSEYIS